MVRQTRREKDFFTKDLSLIDPEGMSEICKYSRFIYDIWQDYGSAGLKVFFENELEIETEEALLISLRYNPSSPPADFCPIKLIKNGDFRKVFEILSLQLPSKNDQNGVWPKNLLAWRVMQKIYGKEVFDFEIVGKTGNISDNGINIKSAPLAEDGNVIPFGLAALNVIKIGDIPASILQKSQNLIDELGDEMGRDFIHTIMKARIIFPPKKVLAKLVSDIKSGLSGKKLIITGLFCPDYDYREVNDPTRPDVKYEYTFNSVGSGVGLVAKQIQRILPHLTDFLDKYGIIYEVVLGIGDFEANSSEILESVGVSYKEFISRCNNSLSAFQASLPKIKMNLVLFEKELANGSWNNLVEEALNSFMKGDFGLIKSSTGKDPHREVKFLAKNGSSFYKKWYKKPNMTIEEVERYVISQAAEYAAVGKILSKSFNGNPFVQMAGDRPKMQIFNNTFSQHATLCAERVY